MAIEEKYKEMNQKQKDKFLLYLASQTSLFLLGLISGFTSLAIISRSITLPISKVLLLSLMMMLCLAIYFKSIGAVNKDE